MAVPKRLTKRQEAGVQAVLLCRTYAQAAQLCGVNERTLRDWKANNPLFREALAAARRDALEFACNALARLSGRSADALRRAHRAVRDQADPRRAAVEVRAAVATLDFCFRANELMDLQARVEELERQARG